MSKWGFVDKHGRVYLEYCPKCKKENHASFVAEGKCCWCGYEAKLKKEIQDEQIDSKSDSRE